MEKRATKYALTYTLSTLFVLLIDLYTKSLAEAYLKEER